MTPDFGIDAARQRVLAAMRDGKWDIVEEQLTRYAGAVRAEERYLAIGDAVDTLTECGGDDGDRPVRDCLSAVQGLR